MVEANRGDRQTEVIRDLVSKHQIVTVIGARGTGKSRIANQLEEAWQRSGATIVRIDASAISNPAGLDAPLSAALECEPDGLTAKSLPAERVVRIILENCQALHSRPWFSGAQERWRALLSSEAARGRVVALLLGRPLFRQIAGGAGSPLLNLGPIVNTRPLTSEFIREEHGVTADCASAIVRKTGGHPHLSALLVEAIGGDPGRLGDVVPDFVAAHKRYLLQLAEDHTIKGQSMLGDLLDAAHPIPEQALVRAHFGREFTQGIETLGDLIAAGLVWRRDSGDCEIAADLLRNVSALRHLLKTPALSIPIGSPDHLTAAVLLVYRIENALRELVGKRLAEMDSAWWATRVPTALAGEAESRREAEADLLGPEDGRLHPIMYLSLGELFDLIQLEDNWEHVFTFAFAMGRDGVADVGRRLSAVRNRIAHSRPVSQDAIAEMQRCARRLGIAKRVDAVG
jgi:hypothetical protein